MLHDIDLREIFEYAHLKFTVSGRSMAKAKQASKHTHTRAQCSHASVGLAQARPNNRVVTVLSSGVGRCFQCNAIFCRGAANNIADV